MVSATAAIKEWNKNVAKILAAYDDEKRLPRVLINAARSITSEEPGSTGYITAPWELIFLTADSPNNFDVPDHLRDLLPLDPFYAAIGSGEYGVMSLRTMMPSAFEQTEYFARVYGDNDLTDELLHVMPLPDDRKMIISLLRNSEAGNFSPAEIEAHRVAHPVLAAASIRLATLWSASHDSNRSRGDFVGRADIETTINEFGIDILTPREQEVISLVLRGHNSESISTSLGIGLHTVKMHRKNSYAKLHINSQGDLFNRLLEALGAPPNPHRKSKLSE